MHADVSSAAHFASAPLALLLMLLLCGFTLGVANLNAVDLSIDTSETSWSSTNYLEVEAETEAEAEVEVEGAVEVESMTCGGYPPAFILPPVRLRLRMKLRLGGRSRLSR